MPITAVKVTINDDRAVPPQSRASITGWIVDEIVLTFLIGSAVILALVFGYMFLGDAIFQEWFWLLSAGIIGVLYVAYCKLTDKSY